MSLDLEGRLFQKRGPTRVGHETRPGSPPFPFPHGQDLLGHVVGTGPNICMITSVLIFPWSQIMSPSQGDYLTWKF